MPGPSSAPRSPDEARATIEKLAAEAGPFDVDGWFAYRDEHPIPPEEWEAYVKAIARLREPSP